MTQFVLIKGGILAFLAVWLFIAAMGNLTDPKTNRTLLGAMLQMNLLRDEPVLGRGLLWRSWNWKAAPATLLLVIATYQLLVVILLGHASWLWFSGAQTTIALAASDTALLAFGAIWCSFMLGGLWFGYWIKTPMLQGVHMGLLMLTLLTIILMHIGL